MLNEDTKSGIAARQAWMRRDGPEAAKPMPVGEGQLPDFLNKALDDSKPQESE